MIASCGFLENKLSQFSKEEGVTWAGSVETLGTRVKRLGAKEKARRKKSSIIKENEAFQKNYMNVGLRSCYVQA